MSKQTEHTRDLLETLENMIVSAEEYVPINPELGDAIAAARRTMAKACSEKSDSMDEHKVDGLSARQWKDEAKARSTTITRLEVTLAKARGEVS